VPEAAATLNGDLRAGKGDIDTAAKSRNWGDMLSEAETSSVKLTT
jgi:hypothetical protein